MLELRRRGLLPDKAIASEWSCSERLQVRSTAVQVEVDPVKQVGTLLKRFRINQEDAMEVSSSQNGTVKLRTARSLV